jgi:hypothetical protein
MKLDGEYMKNTPECIKKRLAIRSHYYGIGIVTDRITGSVFGTDGS